MNKHLSFRFRAFATVLAATSIIGITSASAAPTLSAGTITIGSDMTYPPYDFMDGSTPAGFDADFMAKMSSHMKLTPKFVDTRFASLILGLTGDRYDLIASALYVTPERMKTVDFVPYFVTGGSLLVSGKSNFKPKTMADLCGKRVASLKGAAWVPALHEVSDKTCVPAGKGAIDVREYDTSPEAAQSILANANDAQYDDAGVAKMTVDKLQGRVVISSTSVLNPVVSGIGIKKGNAAVKTLVEQSFAQMKQNGEYKALLKKYNLEAPTQAQISQATTNAK